jgi:hypothetical protein
MIDAAEPARQRRMAAVAAGQCQVCEELGYALIEHTIVAASQLLPMSIGPRMRRLAPHQQSLERLMREID